MVGWHHRRNAHDFQQTPGDSGGQGSLVCCSPWGHKELDMTYRLNSNNKKQNTGCVLSLVIKKQFQDSSREHQVSVLSTEDVHRAGDWS